ncbi:MAG: 6-carboxytetrahydropterin synthase [Alphaproteobacteria bacterium]|nr:6-carboxytetrahydropterin synthase [Alphaproteobacteria bacterium]
MPIVTLTRRETFAAAHRLHSDALSPEQNTALFGKCNHTNGHGHNYTLEVTLRGEVNPETGILFNLTELKAILQERVLARVDHRNMNLDIGEFRTLNPTAENMAVVFWGWLKASALGSLLHEVRLWETDKNVASYRGE